MRRPTPTRHWSEPARSGHFPARGQPETFASDVPAFFALARKPRAKQLREQGADSAHVRDNHALFCYATSATLSRVTKTKSIPGEVVQSESPHWGPVERLLGADLASGFMWMFEVELSDEGRLHAYKHVTTRRHLHLDVAGRAFDYLGDGRYREVAVPSAIARVFVGWERTTAPAGS